MSKCSEPTLRVLARIVFTLSIAFDAAAAYDSQRDAALQWLEEQQLNDGAWGASGLKFRATSLTADAMRASGWMHNSYFAALTWLANHAGANNDDELRRALALYRHGADITALTNRITSEQQPGAPGRDGWGLSALYRQATLDTGVVLRALAEIPNSANHQSAINFLKSSQLSSGAWPSVAGGPACKFTTAILVTALTAFEDLDPSLGGALTSAASYLIQNSSGENANHVKALIAHSLLIHGELPEAQTLLDNLAAGQLANGSWDNDVVSTALVLRAIAAWNGTDSMAHATTVVIPDANLRRAINLNLGRNALDALNQGALARLTTLYASNAGIIALNGLEFAVNLTVADLSDNDITTTAPLDNLENLSELLLAGNPAFMAPNSVEVPTLSNFFLALLAAVIFGLAKKSKHLATISLLCISVAPSLAADHSDHRGAERATVQSPARNVLELAVIKRDLSHLKRAIEMFLLRRSDTDTELHLTPIRSAASALRKSCAVYQNKRQASRALPSAQQLRWDDTTESVAILLSLDRTINEALLLDPPTRRARLTEIALAIGARPRGH